MLPEPVLSLVFSPTPSSRISAGARGRVQIGVSGRLNFVIDADVVEVFVTRADADDVAGLLDGRIGGELPDLVVVCAPVGVDAAEDVNLARRHCG